MPAHQPETINVHLILCYVHTHCIVRYLYNIIAILEHMYISHTYSCVDMCECTNQYWSHDHPKQMLPQFLSTLVNFETIALSPVLNCKLIMLHDSVNFTY